MIRPHKLTLVVSFVVFMSMILSVALLPGICNVAMFYMCQLRGMSPFF